MSLFSTDAPALVWAVALILALLIDHFWGEPPVRLHPVVWMGNYLAWAGRQIQKVASQGALEPLLVADPMADPAADPAEDPMADPMAVAITPDYKAFWLGVLYWCLGATLFTVAASWLQSAVMQIVNGSAGWLGGGLSQLLGAALLALLLKPMLAWAMLRDEVLAVEGALAESVQAGRDQLKWLVSRDTGSLSEAEVRESAIESLAENLSDSVVAPIFWFVLLGLPGVVLYRFGNTADAMWGYKGLYKGENWAWAGKWAARVDDVLNWLPARLTGVLLAATCGVAPRVLRREAVKTPSPNSGWPMAAMALALNIQLAKPGVYALNPEGGAPLPAQTGEAVSYAHKVLLTLVSLALTALIIRAMFNA